ncbi:hypothetical protein SKDZ_07G2380 [Saccharomyces kudriavzevii ZP591]|nr:hypothetical protein SKDZ_07G2380 [Saccharomyces kudriavzevii ZP591]
MEDVIHPLNYPDTDTSRPTGLLETTNNLKNSLKKFSQKAKASHMTGERIHHFRKWKNKHELLPEKHIKSLPDVNFLHSNNGSQPGTLPASMFLSPQSSSIYWSEEQFQLELEILKYLSLNPNNEHDISDY